jgi:hypothetical protein
MVLTVEIWTLESGLVSLEHLGDNSAIVTIIIVTLLP